MNEAEKILSNNDAHEWDDLHKLQMDITNPTGTAQFINLLEYSIQDVVTQYPNLTFSNPIDYNILVQDLESSPIKAKKILFASTSQSQLANPVFIETKYADGTEKGYNEFPIISVDAYQQQGNRVEVVFDELILDTFTFFSNYRINAGETVTVLLYYRQLYRWCILDFPDLFPTTKPITEVINQEINKKFCEREKSFRDQDGDWKCKDGKNVFELTMTNNGSSQTFINLFDNFSLNTVNSLTNPINSLILSAGNYSRIKFVERTVNQRAYTLGSIGTPDIINYDSAGTPTVERTLASAPATFVLSNGTDKMYLGIGTDLAEYTLGSGVLPTLYTQGVPVNGLILDETNNYLFLLRSGSATIRRLDLNNLSSSTTFALTSVPITALGTFSPATNEVVLGVGTDLIGVNAITGVSTVRYSLGAGVIIRDIEYIEDWNAMAFTSIVGGVFSFTVLDTAFNLVGVYSSALVAWRGFSFDTNRSEIALPETTGTIRTLFFTLSSIQNGTFDSFFNTGVGADVAGFMPSFDIHIFGRVGAQPVQLLDRSATIEFANPDAYDYFTESLGEEPVKISCMDIIAQTQQQLVNNIVIQDKDADGYVFSTPESPIIRIDSFQEQGGRSFIKFKKNLVLDGNTTFASYPLDAGETVTMVLYYHQFKRASLLDSDKIKKSRVQNEKHDPNIADNTKKSVIFGAEQVYSDGFTSSRSDFATPFFKKMRVKFKDERADCRIPKPENQILYVNPNEVSFGDGFPVEDISEQGFNQFNDELVDTSVEEWSYRKAKEQYLKKNKRL